MKIGIVCYPTQGGSGIVATELGQLLASRGHEIHFITYDPPFRLKLDSQNIYFHKVEINQYELFKYPDYALTLATKIANVTKYCKLDLLHVHYAIPHATSAYLAKQMMGCPKIKIITTLHGTDITLVGKDPSYYPVVKFSIEHSDGITAVSENLKKQTCHYFGICQEIEVIYNFFTPLSEYVGKKPFKKRFVGSDEKLILHASNFRSVKRVEDVIKIFHIISKQVKSKLLLMGSGDGVASAQTLVEQLNLEQKVVFIESSREIDPVVASADLFLLPSSQESFGLAALEAMAYGVPVVATDVGGLPELIQNGFNGFLSPVGHVQEMAENGIRLLQDHELYQKVSQNGLKEAAKRFSADKIISQYENYYQRVLNRTNFSSRDI